MADGVSGLNPITKRLHFEGQQFPNIKMDVNYASTNSIMPGYGGVNGYTPSLTTGKFGQKSQMDFEGINSPAFPNQTLTISNYDNNIQR